MASSVGTKSTFTAVEIPSFFSPGKEDDSLDLFGGSKELSGVEKGNGKRLQLWCRPEDPHCRPICADVSVAPRLLVRLNRSKSNNESDTASIHASVVGNIGNYYTFSEMADFQFVSRQYCAGSTTTKSKILDLIPPSFSYESTPMTYKFGENTHPWMLAFQKKIGHQISDSNNSDKETSDSTTSKKKRRKSNRSSSSGKFEAKRGFRGEVNPKDLATKLKGLFDTRRIWGRNALTQRLTAKETKFHKLTAIITRFASFRRTGPWARCWVAKGYKPETDYSSSTYQIIDFRAPRDIDLIKFAADKKLTQDEKLFFDNPVRSQTCYQLIDLAASSSKIRGCLEGTANATFHRKTGWYATEMFDGVRAILKAEFRKKFQPYLKHKKGKWSSPPQVENPITKSHMAPISNSVNLNMDDEVEYGLLGEGDDLSDSEFGSSEEDSS